jgi:serine protease AprX
MRKHIILTFLTLVCICLYCSLTAQQNYRVYFTDKNGVKFNPYEYFDQKAVERRVLQGLPLSDFTDFPVNNEYISEVGQIADSTGFASRWFNFVSIVLSSEVQFERIKSLPFVKNIEKAPAVECYPAALDNPDYVSNHDDDMDLMIKQTTRMGGNLFADNHINGKDIRIAIFDAGFPTTNTCPAFEQIRKENRIIKTWDFSRHHKENVYYGVSHGTMVMACIGGIYQGIPIGMATGAEFLLAKTEVIREPFREEENWLAAAEWADKNGADIINSSLGYTYQRYFNYQMDGKTSLVVRAANMAASKGILVVNAAGNEGDTKWHYIGTPADADSILSIGGIDPETDYHIGFSSYGPTVDKRLKPNVSAYGSVTTYGKKGLKQVQGTSFASPLVAGFAACAWQMNRQLKNMEMFTEIEKSGHLYPYFDYAHGYGIPQASYFINERSKLKPLRTFDFFVVDSIIKIVIKPTVINDTNWIDANNLLYYRIQGKDNVIKSYYVVKAEKREALSLVHTQFSPGDRLVVYFRGFTDEFWF